MRKAWRAVGIGLAILMCGCAEKAHYFGNIPGKPQTLKSALDAFAA